MPAGCLRNTTIALIHPLEYADAGWTKDKLVAWIKTAKGNPTTHFTKKTTHVICTATAYKNGVGEVGSAKAARAKGERVHIVSPEWLQETLMQQKKMSEAGFSWEKAPGMNRRGGGGRKKKVVEVEEVEVGDEDGEVEEVVSKPQNVKGMMVEGFLDHTQQFLSEGDRRKIKEQMAREKEMAKLAEIQIERDRREEANRLRRERAEKEAVFRRGAKKGRNEIFSDNHHVYADVTGFKYDITLTKVDTRANRNERYVLTLQIYESNSQPHTYATNLHYAGTTLTPTNTVIAALGCSIATALHAFKKISFEKTKVLWDDRLNVMIEAHAKKERAKAGLPEPGTVRGRPVSESEVVPVVDFARQPFVYHPPVYGSRGVLPEPRKLVTWPPTVAPMTAAEAEKQGHTANWVEAVSDCGGQLPGEGMSDWDLFGMQQQGMSEDARAAMDGEKMILDALPLDLGATGYPFDEVLGNGDGEFDFDAGGGDAGGEEGVFAGGERDGRVGEVVEDAHGGEDVFGNAAEGIVRVDRAPKDGHSDEDLFGDAAEESAQVDEATKDADDDEDVFGITAEDDDEGQGAAGSGDVLDTIMDVEDHEGGNGHEVGALLSETQDSNATQLASDAAMGLNVFMKEMQDAAVTGEGGKAIDLGASVLGKRKGSAGRGGDSGSEGGAEMGVLVKKPRPSGPDGDQGGEVLELQNVFELSEHGMRDRERGYEFNGEEGEGQGYGEGGVTPRAMTAGVDADVHGNGEEQAMDDAEMLQQQLVMG
ncbi:hypothetical protein LTR56_024218 [Elasticomyces elasticus]|nr:hypothetical protein LTR56_024218 [Elasticomyces elasticus]KAK3653073.1 hypothetical protein LTR22_011311 [Elasticomyces elasticus]KAK4919684.1 hypothetical protein LTR49_012748 [Elasticomyces elasticus]KAK5749157.1 hypothetical protein LTS12_020780 [Elasticomyces elasticus]